MENLIKNGQKPPFAIVVPGKCFRNEATDATHEMQFYQIEGLMIGEDVNMSQLKGVLFHFCKKMLGENIEIRFRPSFFPFTEPSIEFDMKFNGKWLEMGGAGMVHPDVLKNCGIDSTKYQGFAFGPGLERLMIIKYGMPDIRPAYQGDLRFNQF
jgi:phenylalanyl-tRNA synthetase alpha chain